MLNGLMEKVIAIGKEEGIAALGKKTVRWLFTRHRLLSTEMITGLAPVSPVDAFEPEDRHARIAVQIHLFYLSLLDEMIEVTNRIPYGFDGYISTDTEEKASMIREAFAAKSRAARFIVAVYPNRGRDVGPFLWQMASHWEGYDYICHLHTKYSSHSSFGEAWRHEILNSLLDSPGHVASLLAVMEADRTVGMIFPPTYWRVKPNLGWMGNKRTVETIMKKLALSVRLPRRPQFPAGNMFWARTDAIAPLLRYSWSVEDFPPEKKQTDGTLAHGVERFWGCLAQAGGYRCLRVQPQKTGANDKCCEEKA